MLADQLVGGFEDDVPDEVEADDVVVKDGDVELVVGKDLVLGAVDLDKVESEGVERDIADGSEVDGGELVEEDVLETFVGEPVVTVHADADGLVEEAVSELDLIRIEGVEEERVPEQIDLLD